MRSPNSSGSSSCPQAAGPHQQHHEAFNVITASQLGRMLAQVSAGDSRLQDTQHKEAERLHLKQLSDARTATWPNTLQAARARKERAREGKAAAEEAARQEADRAEALVRAEQRRAAIDRAGRVLFDATDDAKALHSKLLLSEVAAQNQAQVEFKKHVRGLRAAQDAEFAAQQRQALAAAEAAEAARQAAAKQAALAQKQVQVEQLEQLKRRILDERAAAKAEGELIRRKAVEEAEELSAKEAVWRAQARAMSATTKAANDTLLAFRAAERQREAQLEAAVEAFCQNKAAKDAQRATEAAAKEAAKEAQRAAIRDRIDAAYTAWHAHSEQQLAVHIQAAEVRAEEDAAARQARRQAAAAAEHRSNQQQLARKAAAAEVARREDAAFKEAWGERLQQLRQQEVQEAADARARAKEVVRFQQWQAARTAAGKAAAVTADAQDALMTQVAVAEADARTAAYGAQLMGEVAGRGQPTAPLARHVARADKARAALTPTM